jgi:dihydrolipoamide dehydrogenase
MSTRDYDLIVLGGGPGGYVAAVRAAELGLSVACVDKNAELGGTCLRVGCIPSKALLESSQRFAEAQHDFSQHGIRLKGVELDLAAMMARKQQIVGTLCGGIDGLFKKHKVARFLGHGRLDGPGRVVVEEEKGETLLRGRRIIIATGSQPLAIPGVELDGERIASSTEALAYDEVPRHLVVIGAGYIGLELGSVWRRLGAKVTVLEALDRILPGIDAELAHEAQTIFARQGLEFRLKTRVRRAAAAKKRGECVVECEGAEPIHCDQVLLAVGRVPYTQGLNLESAGVTLDAKGRIEVDGDFATRAEGIYAIGDCIRGPMLAHKASDEAVACVEQICTGYGRVEYEAIPAVVYTHPEIASVGKTAEQLDEQGIEYRQASFRFRANGRALTLGEPEGRVKIVVDARTDRILGVHILGPRAGDLISEAAAAVAFAASGEDIARVPHAHPTLAEAVREAAQALEKRAAGPPDKKAPRRAPAPR